jgi:hypothetical protein
MGIPVGPGVAKPVSIGAKYWAEPRDLNGNHTLEDSQWT